MEQAEPNEQENSCRASIPVKQPVLVVSSVLSEFLTAGNKNFPGFAQTPENVKLEALKAHMIEIERAQAATVSSKGKLHYKSNTSKRMSSDKENIRVFCGVNYIAWRMRVDALINARKWNDALEDLPNDASPTAKHTKVENTLKLMGELLD